MTILGFKQYTDQFLSESVFTNREGEFGYKGTAKVLDGPQYQLRNLIHKKVTEIAFSKKKQRFTNNMATKKSGDNKEFFIGINSLKTDKKPLVASTNRFVHTGTLREILNDIFGDELDLLGMEDKIKVLNDKLAKIADIESEEGQAILDEITLRISKELNKRPKQLLGSNLKIKHSNIGTIVMKKIGFPAFHSIFYDELEKKWRLLRTCPDAGACVGLCFGAKGMFTLTSKHAVSGTRTVNFMMNDPDGFVNKLVAEINAEVNTKAYKADPDKRLYIRVHDVGDFFSEYYFDIFMMIAKKLPHVTFFAYTKSLKLLSMKEKEDGAIPDNFIFNRSEGGKDSKLPDLDEPTPKTEFFDRSIHKHSSIILKKFFKDDAELKRIGVDMRHGKQLLSMNTPTVEKKDKAGNIITPAMTSNEKWDILKKFIAKRYDIPVTSIHSYDEFVKMYKHLDPKKPINVIVFPGDGDVSATTKGVLGTYLIEH